jgi:thiol:disulfide interchange protein DsbG
MRALITLASLILSVALTTPSFALERAKGPLLKGEAMQKAADSMWRDIGQAAWIRDGQSKHVLYVFFDPNCPFCKRVYEGARARVEIGDVELRWIPIAVLMATSPGKAAALLEAKDPTEALHINEREFSVATGSFGGIGEEPVPKPETEAKLARNLALLRRSGMDSTPALLFRTKSGQVRFVVGAPPEPALISIIENLE